MKNFLKALLVLYLVLSIIIYWFSGSAVSEDIVFLAPVFLLVFACGLLLKNTGIKKGIGRTFGLLGIGFVSWAIAEVIFIYFFEFLGIDPFPSIADVFYIIAYPFFFAAIINEIYNYGGKFKESFTWSKTLLLIVITGITIFVQAQVIFDPSATILETFANASYGFGDLILIISAFFLIDIVGKLRNAKFSLPWVFFIFGMLANLVADLLFAQFYNQYEEGLKLFLQIDVIFIAGYLFFFYSLYLFYEILSDLQKKITSNGLK